MTEQQQRAGEVVAEARHEWGSQAWALMSRHQRWCAVCSRIVALSVMQIRDAETPLAWLNGIATEARRQIFDDE